MLVTLLAVAAAATTVNVPDTLGNHLDRAVERSNIPVLVPETIKTEFRKVYPSSLSVPKGRYSLTIGAAKNCNGASVCGIANFYAVEGETVQPRGKKVKLAKGHTGRYRKSTCGANCSFPAISWYHDDALYTIEHKESAGKRNMVRLANSAIKAGPR